MITTGFYDTVPIGYIRDGAKVLLNIQNDNSCDDILDFHITQGIKALNAPNSLMKINCTIELAEQKVGKLPSGFIKLLAYRIPCDEQTSSENGITHGSMINYVDRAFYESCGGEWDGGLNDFAGTFMIENGYIYFSKAFADEIEISYMGVAINNCGERLIYERYQIPLQYYAAFQYGLTHLGRPYVPEQVRTWNGYWKAQKKMIIGDDLKDTWNKQKRKIRQIMQTKYWF